LLAQAALGGNTSEMREPVPRWLSIVSRPSWQAINPDTMLSPSPLPSYLRASRLSA
jgi:hypothetical protein